MVKAIKTGKHIIFMNLILLQRQFHSHFFRSFLAIFIWVFFSKRWWHSYQIAVVIKENLNFQQNRDDVCVCFYFTVTQRPSIWYVRLGIDLLPPQTIRQNVEEKAEIPSFVWQSADFLSNACEHYYFSRFDLDSGREWKMKKKWHTLFSPPFHTLTNKGKSRYHFQLWNIKCDWEQWRASFAFQIYFTVAKCRFFPH